MATIGVIVPVYNVEKYLSQCIESILCQTYTDFELILVNDGSTDSSPSICNEYSHKDPRIRVINKQNGGLSDARNCGIDSFHGEYITFVDSDDFLLPDALMTLANLCKSQNADMSCCGSLRCECEQTVENLTIPPLTPVSVVYTNDRMHAFLSGKLIGTMAWAKLYSAKLLSDIRYPVGKYHEDVFTTYKLVHEAKKIAVTNQPCYVYRKNPVSITQKFTPKRFDSVEGELQQANFIEEMYPDLISLAYSKLIYACNQCIIQMAKADYHDEVMEQKLQNLYRRYARYYILGNSSGLKKVFVCIATIDVRLAMMCSQFLQV